MCLSNFKIILNKIHLLNNKVNLIVVCKNQEYSNIKPLLNFGHRDFGENRIQETTVKWSTIFDKHNDLNLHFLGKLQTNKIKTAVSLFNYIHSLDSQKLALKLDEQETLQKKRLKYFIQVNIGYEKQKSGIHEENLVDFLNFCKSKTKLNIIGLMCLPPLMEDSNYYFKKLYDLSRQTNLKELSMGMSGDFEMAIKNGATFVRVGSAIFSKTLLN